MNDKKTRVAMGATRAVGPKTVVMDRPPDMTIELGPELQKELQIAAGRRPARSKTPSMMVTSVFRHKSEARSSAQPVGARPTYRPNVPPPIPAAPRAQVPALSPCLKTIDLPLSSDPAHKASMPGVSPKTPQRTRMVNLRDALDQPQLPPLPTHLAQFPVSHTPPAFPPGFAHQPAQMPMGTCASELPWKQRFRWPLFALTGFVLLILLIVPSLGDDGAQAQVGDEELASESPNNTNATKVAKSESAAPIPRAAALTRKNVDNEASSHSEARAGAALLSGRRAEALQIYRVLADRPNADPAIEAMVIVLQQKVNQP